MNNKLKLLLVAGELALVAAIAAPAHAAGTAANSSITNTVTVNYSVQNVAQTAITANNSFVVDRKINLTVAENGNTTTQVTPGAQLAVTSFTVTNTSNAVLDLGLAVTQPNGGTTKHGGTDNFDATNVRIYRDVNNNGLYDDGTDTLVTYLDQVAADASINILVVVDVPLGRSTGDVAGVRLTATAFEGNAAGSQGAAITQTSGANTAGMDTVFADDIGASDGNVARDGASFADDDYTVSAAALTVEKTSRVISDPLNGTTDPKMIPGATVEYCIAVYNAAGGASATNIAISDALPAQTSYLGAYGIFVNGTTSATTPGSTCNEDGSAGGSITGSTISATLSDIAAGSSRTVRFRVTVQ